MSLVRTISGITIWRQKRKKDSLENWSDMSYINLVITLTVNLKLDRIM